MYSKYWLIEDELNGLAGVEFDYHASVEEAVNQYCFEVGVEPKYVEAYPVTKTELYLSEVDIY